MNAMVNSRVQFKAKLLELEKIFEAVVAQKGDTVSSEIIVGKNDSLVVCVGTDYWACPLSPKECNFLSELLQRGGRINGNDAKQCGKPFDDHVIRNIHKSINRKLKTKKVPVRLHFVDWVISIEITLF
jgi:hypothetical protein